MALHALALREGAAAPEDRWQGRVAELELGGQAVALLTPLTFMNGSGASVAEALRSHAELAPEQLLVVHDDLDLPLGRLRLRGSGGAGGQRGLADILEAVGSRDVPRLRIGVGRPPPGVAVSDWVLSDFRPDEAEPLRDAVGRACDAMLGWATHGLDRTMDVVNRAATTGEGG